MPEAEEDLATYLRRFSAISDNIYLDAQNAGYWSNLSQTENSQLISLIESGSTEDAITSVQPHLYDVIFSSKRAAALELLQLDGSETVVDLGCMWGALAIPLAKQASSVLGIDQTIESLQFTAARAAEAELTNISFLCGNLRDLDLPRATFDVAVVNGVLEWIPESDPLVVSDYLSGARPRTAPGDPGLLQRRFLENVHSSLKPGGRLFLAIENRFDYKMWVGVKDPHNGTYFTTIAPRWLANIISKGFKGREYRPWIYSFRGLEGLLQATGYGSVSLFACWPDYRFPEHIQTYGERNQHFRPVSSHRNDGRRSLRRIIANRLEWLLFQKLNFQSLAPSIIAIAER